MSNRALQLKVNINASMTHYMAGAETSSMRIFDMASTVQQGGADDLEEGMAGVIGTLTPPRRQGADGGSGLEAFLNEQDKGRMTATFIGHRYALAGTSDGQLLAFDLKGDQGDQLALLASSSQLSVTAMAAVDLPTAEGGAQRCLVFLLLEDGSLSVVELSTMVGAGKQNGTTIKPTSSFFGNGSAAASAPGVFTRLLVDSHALAGDGGRIQNPSAVAATLAPGQDGTLKIRVLACGVSSAVYQYVYSANNSSTTSAVLEKVCHFSCGAVHHAWLSTVSTSLAPGAPQSQVAILADNHSGTIRLYNVGAEEKGITRARLSMSCSQRIVNVNVTEKKNEEGAGSSGTVVATTFTGQVFVWTLANMRPEIVVQLAAPPAAELVSQHPRGRLIGGGFSRAFGAGSSNQPQQLILARGSFAAPIFEAFEWAHLKDSYKHSTRIGGGGAFSTMGRRVAYHVPFDLRMGKGATNSELAQFRSTHGKVSKIVPTVSGALGGIEFQDPELHQAKSMRDLPAIRSGGAADTEEDLEGDHQLAGGFSNQARAALGATTGLAVPLYQALHARDDGQVLELMSVAGRSDEDLAATISQLDVPNLVHLLHIIAKRLKTVGARHPLHQWVRIILICKGVFLSNYAKQEQAEALAKKKESDDSASPSVTQTSSVAAVMAPLLFQYQGYLEMRDRLCHCYGRLGTFHGVRPKREKATVALGDERKKNKKGKMTSSSKSGKDEVDTRLYRHVFQHNFVEGHNGHVKEVMLPDNSEESRMARKRARLEGLEMLGDEFDDEVDGGADDDSEAGDMLQAALGEEEEDVDALAARAAEEDDDDEDFGGEDFGDEDEEEEDEEEEEEGERRRGGGDGDDYDDEEASEGEEDGDYVPTELRDARVLRRAGKRGVQDDNLQLDDY